MLFSAFWIIEQEHPISNFSHGAFKMHTVAAQRFIVSKIQGSTYISRHFNYTVVSDKNIIETKFLSVFRRWVGTVWVLVKENFDVIFFYSSSNLISKFSWDVSSNPFKVITHKLGTVKNVYWRLWAWVWLKIILSLKENKSGSVSKRT